VDWFYCLQHRVPEPEGHVCRAEARLGPSPTQAAALAWRETVEGRNEAWDEQDEAWDGPDDDEAED
jgi:hypothetical protein